MKVNISMSKKETERIAIMDNLVAKRIKQKHASSQLGISVRQVQRMVKRYKQEGLSGLIHKSRGRVGNRAMKQEKRNMVVHYKSQEKYHKAKPTAPLIQFLEI